MFRLKTLIHMLSCMALSLNGVGAASAPVEMAAPPVHAVASVDSKVEKQADTMKAAMQSGCHEHHSSTASPSLSASTTHVDADVMNPVPTEGEADSTDSTDCCKDGTCSCGCVHQCQVVLAAELLVMPAIAPPSIQWERLPAPLSPSLSKPVRPPIA